MSAIRPTGGEDLEQLAARWGLEVARALDLPPPTQPQLQVHEAAGISRVEGGVIHLHHTPDGRVDVDRMPHELVHLIAGLSPSRFLSEGLAVHIAAQLPLGEPCWPAFRLAPDLWVTELRRRRKLPSIAELFRGAQSLRLASADPGTAWRLYVIAGSFVGRLFQHMPRGDFWEGYGSRAAWPEEGRLVELEAAWLASLPEELDANARTLLAASVTDQRPQPGEAAILSPRRPVIDQGPGPDGWPS